MPNPSRGTGRGNHREGQNVNNLNVDRRQEIRNQVTQLANTQNPFFDIRNNLVYILADILAYILADALSINISHKCSIVEITNDFDFLYVGPKNCIVSSS